MSDMFVEKNEIFIEADNYTRQIFLSYINKMNDTLEFPKQWQKGKIIRIYKGKGTKGKCSNERGITLGSNFGKVVERIYNERALRQVKITDYQGGGRGGTQL